MVDDKDDLYFYFKLLCAAGRIRVPNLRNHTALGVEVDHRSRAPGTRRHYDDVALHDRLEELLGRLESERRRTAMWRCAVVGVLTCLVAFHVMMLVYLITRR